MNQAEQISQAIATVERQISEAKSETAKKVLAKKLERLKEDLKKEKPSLSTLPTARKQVKALEPTAFQKLVQKLSEKTEYAFLKDYSQERLLRDKARTAKPKGYRFKGDNDAKPTLAQIKKGLKDGTVYYEGRPIRSDVSREIRLEKGGSIASFNWNNFTLKELNQALPLDVEIWSYGTPEKEYNRPYSPENKKLYTTKRLTISQHAEAEISKGDENIYLEVKCYDAEDKNDMTEYEVSIYSKENHSGLKEVAKSLIEKMKLGGSIKTDLKALWDKTVDIAKKGYDKTKQVSKKKIHDGKKAIAIDVINETKGKVGKTDKSELNKAKSIIVKKFADGGTVKFRKLAKSNNFDIVVPEGRYEVELDANNKVKSIVHPSGTRHKASECPIYQKYKKEINEYLTERFEDGGRIDLFEDYENIPPRIQGILDEYSEDFEDGNYEGMGKALEEVEAEGYTFDFYVDGSAYGLRPKGVKLSELQGYEDVDEDSSAFEKGGNIDSSYLGTTRIGKGHYGWTAKTTTKKQINGYDWEITTMKRSSGDLVSSANGGKAEQKQGFSTFMYSPFEDPSLRLISSKPKMVNEKAVTKQHEEALKLFIEKLNEASGKMATGGSVGTYSYLPKDKISKIVLKSNQVIGKDRILDGAYLKGKLLKDSKPTKATKISKSSEEVYNDLIKYVKETYPKLKFGENKDYYFTESMIQDLIDANYSEKEIKGFVLGLNNVIKVDSDNEFIYLDGLQKYGDDYKQKYINLAVEASKNKAYELGLKYPSFNWKPIITKYKIDLKPVLITRKRQFASGDYDVYTIVCFVGKDIVIGGTAKREHFKDGKLDYEDVERNPSEIDGKFNEGYWGIVSSKKEVIMDVAEMLLSQKEGYVKEMDFLTNDLGGVGSEELVANKVKFEDGGSIENLKVGSQVEIELGNGKLIKGVVEKTTPLKIRTDANSTQVIPNALIKKIKQYATGGNIRSDVEKYKKQLIAKAKSKGLYENFGQAEVRKLEDKYGYTSEVRAFDDWAMNFDLSSLRQYATGGNISNEAKNLASMTGTSAEAVESFFKENGLDHMGRLKVTAGVGRGHLSRKDFATAIAGEKGNKYVKEIIEYSKTENAFKMATGGNLEYTYIPNDDISKIIATDGTEYGEKVILDGAYVTDKVRKPKMSRTQFEDDTYSFGNGGNLGKSLYVAYSSYFDYNAYDTNLITHILKAIGAKNIRLEKESFNSPEVVVFNGDKEKAREALNSAFDTEAILVYEKDWKKSKYATGGNIERDRLFNFLKDDLATLETAISENDQEEIERFFSYWNQHLKSLKSESNERMFNFLSEDLQMLETAIREDNQEEVEKFFSYWNHHLESIKYAIGGNIERDRLFNFLKDDLTSLEIAIKNNDEDKIYQFFSYWNQHLDSLKSESNERMLNFLKQDLEKLQENIEEKDEEDIDNFLSYWGQHLESIKYADGGNLDDFEDRLFWVMTEKDSDKNTIEYRVMRGDFMTKNSYKSKAEASEKARELNKKAKYATGGEITAEERQAGLKNYPTLNF